MEIKRFKINIGYEETLVDDVSIESAIILYDKINTNKLIGYVFKNPTDDNKKTFSASSLIFNFDNNHKKTLVQEDNFIDVKLIKGGKQKSGALVYDKWEAEIDKNKLYNNISKFLIDNNILNFKRDNPTLPSDIIDMELKNLKRIHKEVIEILPNEMRLKVEKKIKEQNKVIIQNSKISKDFKNNIFDNESLREDISKKRKLVELDSDNDFLNKYIEKLVNSSARLEMLLKVNEVDVLNITKSKINDSNNWETNFDVVKFKSKIEEIFKINIKLNIESNIIIDENPHFSPSTFKRRYSLDEDSLKKYNKSIGTNVTLKELELLEQFREFKDFKRRMIKYLDEDFLTSVENKVILQTNLKTKIFTLTNMGNSPTEFEKEINTKFKKLSLEEKNKEILKTLKEGSIYTDTKQLDSQIKNIGGR